MDKTEAPSPADRGSGSNDQLGRAPERLDLTPDQMRALLSQLAGELQEARAALPQAVRNERERWRAAAEYAAHQLEKARIWGGMEWQYNPLHPMHYLSALERLRDVLRA